MTNSWPIIVYMTVDLNCYQIAVPKDLSQSLDLGGLKNSSLVSFKRFDLITVRGILLLLMDWLISDNF